MNKIFYFAFWLAAFCISLLTYGQSQWRGPNRDGVYPESNLLKEWPVEGPELLWSFEGLGIGQGSVVFSKDKIFSTGIPSILNFQRIF